MLGIHPGLDTHGLPMAGLSLTTFPSTYILPRWGSLLCKSLHQTLQDGFKQKMEEGEIKNFERGRLAQDI